VSVKIMHKNEAINSFKVPANLIYSTMTHLKESKNGKFLPKLHVLSGSTRRILIFSITSNI
jgi:hypothetical protein